MSRGKTPRINFTNAPRAGATINQHERERRPEKRRTRKASEVVTPLTSSSTVLAGTVCSAGSAVGSRATGGSKNPVVGSLNALAFPQRASGHQLR